MARLEKIAAIIEAEFGELTTELDGEKQILVVRFKEDNQ